MRTTVIVALVVGFIAAVWWVTHQRNKETVRMKQDLVNRAIAALVALPSVVASATTALATQRASFQAEFDKLKEQFAGREDVDLSGMEEALSNAEAAEGDLAKAVAAGTPAAAEVHADDPVVSGGTGTDETVVEPVATDIPVETPAPEGGNDGG